MNHSSEGAESVESIILQLIQKYILHEQCPPELLLLLELSDMGVAHLVVLLWERHRLACFCSGAMSVEQFISAVQEPRIRLFDGESLDD
ncbi:MAG: hypothetical protein KBD15_02225 [Candidatus Magasanikbacteria bacterium]|jgi:hypothetical protein|nr:hypothetical protein [Candidatus Magasanikbacteria bacterium]